MDKKYIADKRNKSKKYKNSKYHKKEETIEKINDSGDNHKTQQQQVIEDVIPNNWSRYELKDDDDEQLLCGEGADYETLLLAPISIDSHFKFKSEQNWDEDIKSKIELSKYFTLNIALLNEGISCVPFIKRQGYDESIISPLELELTKTTSEANLKKYKQTLLRKFPPKSNIIITNASDIIKPEEPSKVITETPTNEKPNDVIIPEVKEIKTNKEPPPSPINEDDNIDDLLNLKCTDLIINDESDNIKVEDPLLEDAKITKVVTNLMGAPQPGVDLEQWLDDILDD